MSIPNCYGCEEELNHALDYQDNESLHLVQQELTKIGLKGHVKIMMVNDNGKVLVF